MAAGLFGGPLADISSDDLTTLKRQFLASLNFEIRTPLSGILGMTDLLLETDLKPEQQEYVTTTRNCALALMNILNATLEYSALSAGSLRLDETEFDLADLLDSALNEFAPRAQEKGLELTWRRVTPLPEFVLGDAVRFRQLLSCLIDNSIKFTASGSVEVTLESAGASGGQTDILVSVRDTGIGVAPERIQEIFESFRQLDGGLARAQSGLGLGLAIAQKLAELMHGEIRVTSQPGAGSCFAFRVPLRLPAGQAVAHTDQAAPGRRDYRLLVAEDNLIARKVVTHVLRQKGYLVDCAEDGQQAIAAAQNASYDLILMDLQMPGVDGLTATAVIRALPGYAATPVIAFTANSFSDTRALCRENGMQAFITKPVNASELVNTLRQFLP